MSRLEYRNWLLYTFAVGAPLVLHGHLLEDMDTQEDRSAHVKSIVYIAFLSIVLPVATIAIGLRIWIRLRVVGALRKDDYILILAHTINLLCTGFWMYVQVRESKYEPRSPELFAALAIPFIICIGCYVFASLFVKIAIGLFFLRIAQKKWQKYIVLVPIWVYSICIVLTLSIFVFRCGLPINAIAILGSNNCYINAGIEQPLGLNIASLNAVCDWIFAAIPIHLLLTSGRMSRDSKLSICCIIALAAAGSVVSIIRLPYFIGSTFDVRVFETNPVILFLSILETAVGTIAISLATLKPLLRIIRPMIKADAHVPEGIAQGQGGPPPKCRTDWLYTTKTDRLTSRDIDLRHMRGVGILPDITLDATNVTRDDDAREQGKDSRGGSAVTTMRSTRIEIGSIDGIVGKGYH
ncbi:hypothetical protein CAC42_4029 [Sphaceloma murrayae]|uniref:Rhodopsin domain-containing protein n=1 Tax=Sphaceloma murrayae TaxID=2082308 RepID=A0A2K1QT18_9PEZI|nr:hypothetical protein CAC42_4029 [Sphaceloma murrayae]